MRECLTKLLTGGAAAGASPGATYPSTRIIDVSKELSGSVDGMLEKSIDDNIGK